MIDFWKSMTASHILACARHVVACEQALCLGKNRSTKACSQARHVARRATEARSAEYFIL